MRIRIFNAAEVSERLQLALFASEGTSNETSKFAALIAAVWLERATTAFVIAPFEEIWLVREPFLRPMSQVLSHESLHLALNALGEVPASHRLDLPCIRRALNDYI